MAAHDNQIVTVATRDANLAFIDMGQNLPGFAKEVSESRGTHRSRHNQITI